MGPGTRRCEDSSRDVPIASSVAALKSSMRATLAAVLIDGTAGQDDRAITCPSSGDTHGSAGQVIAPCCFRWVLHAKTGGRQG